MDLEQITRILSFAAAFLISGISFVHASEGDPEVGRALFTGAQSFENGALACRSCHSYAGIGPLGGGSMAPERKWDLTESYKKLNQAVVLWPQTLQPMKAIYSAKPLTDEEKNDLLAFIEQGRGRAPDQIVTLAVIAAGGALIIYLLIPVLWVKRRGEVRRPMYERSYKIRGGFS